MGGTQRKIARAGKAKTGVNKKAAKLKQDWGEAKDRYDDLLTHLDNTITAMKDVVNSLEVDTAIYNKAVSIRGVAEDIRQTGTDIHEDVVGIVGLLKDDIKLTSDVEMEITVTGLKIGEMWQQFATITEDWSAFLAEGLEIEIDADADIAVEEVLTDEDLKKLEMEMTDA